MIDLLNKFNVMDMAQGWLWSLTSWLPHKRSHKGRKIGKLRVEGGVRWIRVDRSATSGSEAEAILKAAHIPIGGRRITSQEASFLVRARQAAWAELILLRAGVKLAENHKIIDPHNISYAVNKGPLPLWGGSPPTEQPTEQVKCETKRRKTKPVTSRQTISKARRLLERITDSL